jgi:hypothetical protein
MGRAFRFGPSRQPVMLQKENGQSPRAKSPTRDERARATGRGEKRAGTLNKDGALNVPLRQKEGGLKPPLA